MVKNTNTFGGNRFSSSVSELQEANRNPISGCMKTPLLLLEEAVVSVVEVVPDVQTYAATAKRRCRQNTPLTINESAAIYLYTATKSFFWKLNEALRHQNPSALNRWYPYLKLFLTALHKLPPCSATVWRGVNEQIGEEFVEDAMHTWPSVTSCSSHVDTAGFFADHWANFICIHAIRGKDMSTYSANQNEEEILLLPETRLRVQSTLPDAAGRSVVHLEEW